MTRILRNKKAATQMNMALGKLVVADAYSSFEKLDDLDFLIGAMNEAAKAGRLNILASEAHRFEPHGVSAILILQESHFSVHTWPEYGFFAADIFACGKEGDAEKAMSKFMEIMEAKNAEVKVFERGVLRNI